MVTNKNKSFSITAEIEVPEGGAEGVIIAQGGAFGGFSLYVKDGKPAYCYNLFGLHRFKATGTDAIPSGTHQVRMEFTYDGGGLGKGGDVALYLDGEQVGSGRVDGTVPMLFSADETTDVGSDSATPVSDDHSSKGSAFTGKGPLGADRRRRRCRGHRPSDLARRAPARRDGAPVGQSRGIAADDLEGLRDVVTERERQVRGGRDDPCHADDGHHGDQRADDLFLGQAGVQAGLHRAHERRRGRIDRDQRGDSSERVLLRRQTRQNRARALSSKQLVDVPVVAQGQSP